MPTVSPRTDVLIVTDIQNDFLPGGALAVPRGDESARAGERAGEKIHAGDPDAGLASAGGHISFASTHPWPQAARGAGPARRAHADPLAGPLPAGLEPAPTSPPGMDIAKAELVIRKGYDRDLDSYFRFHRGRPKDADGACRLHARTRLHPRLRHRPRHRFLRRLDGDRRGRLRLSRPISWRTPAGRSMPTARWRGPWRTWTRSGVRRIATRDLL